MGARQGAAEPQGNLLGVLRLNSWPRCPCPALALPFSECTSGLSTQGMFFLGKTYAENKLSIKSFIPGNMVPGVRLGRGRDHPPHPPH